MIIILLGPPGSGKGTVAELLQDEYSFPVLASGELLRQEMQAGTAIGQEVAQYLDLGELVPDKTINALMKKELHRVTTADTVIFDGYPRTLQQARALGQLLSDQPKVFYLDIPRSVLMDRLLARGRADDTREIIENRFEVYEEETAPLIRYYEQQDALVRLQAETSVEIFEEITTYL